MKKLLAIILLLCIANFAYGTELESSGALTAADYTITNWASEAGWRLWHGDDYRQTSGSASLNDAKVGEGLDAYQGSLHVIYRPDFSSSDDATRYLYDGGAIELYWDGGNTQWTAVVNGVTISRTDTFVVNDELYLYLSWDSNAPTLDLDADGTSAVQITSAQTVGAILATPQIGADQSQLFNASGLIAWRVSDAIESSYYNAGAGDADFFVVTPSVKQLSLATDDDTGVVYTHAGKGVTAISAGGTEATLTTDAGSNTALIDGEAVLIEDGTGYSKQGFVDGTPSSTSVLVDDGAGAAVSGIEDVGVYADLDGSSEYFSRSDADFPESGIVGANDLTIQGWIKPTDISDNKHIVAKYGEAGNKRMYRFRAMQAELNLQLSSDGSATVSKTTAGVSLIAGIWAHVAVVYDASAGTADFYKNGIFVEQETGFPNSIADKDPDFTIGTKDGGTAYFDGGLFNVCLFDDKRTAAEILTSAITPTEDCSGEGNIIGQWMFNDAAAVTQIDNTEGDAGRDLNLVGGTTTNFGTHTRAQDAHVSKNFLTDGTMSSGGIGGWTAGDAATTLSKSTTQIKSGTQSLKVLNADGSQAFARQTLTTVASDDYVFRGWFYAPDTPNGASQLVDVDATAALGITVTQAGLSAGWNWVEFCFTAADTSTTIDLGSGSVTDTEMGYWDQVEIRENLIANGSMESFQGGDPDIPTSWTNIGLDPGDMIKAGNGEVDTERHSGDYCAKYVAAKTNERIYQEVNVPHGTSVYTWSIYAKGDVGGESLRIHSSGRTNNSDLTVTLTTSWKKYSVTTAAGANGNGYLQISSYAAAQTFYIDDTSLILLDTAAANTETKQEKKPTTIPDFQQDY